VLRFPRLSAVILFVAAGGLIVACGNPNRPVTLPGPDQAQVARGAVRALAALGSGAEPSPPAETCGEASAPTALTGDLNGDGTTDVVMWAVVDGRHRLVAVFARLDGEYLAVPVGELDGDGVPVGVLEIERRGTPYQLASLAVDFFFGLDTVVTRACDGTRIAWFWTGSRFEPQRLAS